MNSTDKIETCPTCGTTDNKYCSNAWHLKDSSVKLNSEDFDKEEYEKTKEFMKEKASGESQEELKLIKLSGTNPASEVNSVCNFTEDRNYPEAILFAEWLLREKTTEYLVGDFQGEMEEVYKEFIKRKKT